MQFQRQLGLPRYETAFQMLHKLRAGMVRPNQDRIGGRAHEHVEVDETYVGGRTQGQGHRVRGTQGQGQVHTGSAHRVRVRSRIKNSFS